MKKIGRGFLGGAAILAAAGIICRLLGVVIRIPLCNIVGNFGMGLYQMVYPLYALLLVVSSAGFPVAISKMVAREKVNGNLSAARRILLNSAILLGLIGLIVSALFMIFSANIASLQGNRDVWIIYLAIAPSVFLVCLISAFRGYFQGLQNMIPTATSQILEQLIKVACGIALAAVLIRFSVVWAVFGAILAVTVSEIGALLFLIVLYAISCKKNAKPAQTKENTKAAQAFKRCDFGLMWQILKQAVPITLMASVFPLILVLDSMIVINFLRNAGTESAEATKLFGISSGAVHTLINMPAVLGAAIATAIVPAVSALMKQDKIQELREKMYLSIKITFLISIFFMAFYVVFPEKIIDLLYHRAFVSSPDHLKLAGRLMIIESALILGMSICALFTAMLQGIDKSKYPLFALFLGGAAKIVFELCFLKTPLGIYSVSIGNVLCFAISAILTAIFALRFIKIKKGVVSNLARLAGLAAAFAVLLRLTVVFMPSGRWWLLLDGVIAIATYAILLALFGFFRFTKKAIGNNTITKEK